MTDFYRSLYMRQIQNIAFFSILAFPAIQLHCFFERTIVAGVFRVHSIPGLRSYLTYPGLLKYHPSGIFVPLTFLIFCSSYLFCIRLCPAGPFLLQSTKRKKKSCQSHPTSRLTVFSSRPTSLKTRQKPFPPTPARTTLTGHPCFSPSGELGT